MITTNIVVSIQIKFLIFEYFYVRLKNLEIHQFSISSLLTHDTPRYICTIRKLLDEYKNSHYNNKGHCLAYLMYIAKSQKSKHSVNKLNVNDNITIAAQKMINIRRGSAHLQIPVETTTAY